MLNEAAVEDSVAALGFEIVDPLRLSFGEQIALMDGAQIIAGGYGSAMHNSLFARRGTKLFCVNRANWYQSAIGALRAQPMAYLPPEDGRFRDWRMQGTEESRYVVNCKALRDSLLRFEAWRP
jgi:capsular polysaccharide biosynthesis protein